MRKILVQNHCKWHLLFPLGMQERTTSPSGEGRVLTFDARWCQALVSHFGEYMQASAAYGMPPQPLGVYEMHSVVKEMRGEEVEGTTRRAGNVLALHFHAGGDEVPPGVWALLDVPYYPSGLPFLSPTTTETGYTLASGQRIAGPFFFEVSVVPQPHLETIGSVADGVPWALFPLPEWADAESTPEGLPTEAASLVPRSLRDRLAHHAGQMICRSAIHLRGAMDPATETNNMTLTPDQLQSLVQQAVQSALAPVMERLGAMEADVRSMKSSYEDRSKDAATPAAPAEPAAPAAPAQEMDTRSADAKLFMDGVEKTLQNLLKEQRILPRNAQEFRTRSLEGRPVADLLGDFSLSAQLQGQPGADTERSPAEKKAEGKVTLEDLAMRAKAKFPEPWQSKDREKHLRELIEQYR
jgi:hypothetical protein